MELEEVLVKYPEFQIPAINPETDLTEWFDILGRRVVPGDVIALAKSYSSTASLGFYLLKTIRSVYPDGRPIIGTKYNPRTKQRETTALCNFLAMEISTGKYYKNKNVTLTTAALNRFLLSPRKLEWFVERMTFPDDVWDKV